MVRYGFLERELKNMTTYYRKYDNYDEYLEHQSKKLTKLLKKSNIYNRCVRPEHFNKRVRKLVPKFKRFKHLMRKGKVLCLGARTGIEVKAFRKLGFRRSVGIDLNPGKNNRYVIQGDFHNMEFKDNYFFNAFTNSLDHIFDIEKFSKEVHRVLKPKGIFVLEISHYLDRHRINWKKSLNLEGKYESFYFNNFRDIKNGFKEFKIIEVKKLDNLIVILKSV